MICADCAAAADLAAGRFAALGFDVPPATARYLQRGHARCRTQQLTAGHGQLNDGTPVTINGHHCDCQHRPPVVGDEDAAPARSELPQGNDGDVRKARARAAQIRAAQVG